MRHALSSSDVEAILALKRHFAQRVFTLLLVNEHALVDAHAMTPIDRSLMFRGCQKSQSRSPPRYMTSPGLPSGAGGP